VTPAALDKAALALPGAEVSIKWGADRVFSVGGKMFAATDLAGGHLSLKVSDIAFEALVDQGRARPAPYAARFKWVMFDDLAALDDAGVKDLLKAAHRLVAEKLPKKQRAALGLAG
jgi:predicted DNA-binding protein (MmcQ/YjbR family)